MVSFKIFLAAIACGLANAWPEPTAAAALDNRAIVCSKLTGCFKILQKIGPPATTFCRSYLKVPGTKTSTTTITPPAVTSTISTITVTVTSAVCVPQKRTPDQGLDYARAANFEDFQKRTDVLGLLAGFAAAKISEGCSCLNLNPTATKIATFAAAAPTINVVATSTSCVIEAPVCKISGLDTTCTTNSECCTGLCGTTFGTSTCCNAGGAPCDLNDPGSCCSGTCFRDGGCA